MQHRVDEGYNLIIGALDTRTGQIARKEDAKPEERDYEKLAAGLLYLELEKTKHHVRGIPMVMVNLPADSPDIAWYESLGLRQTDESLGGEMRTYGVASVKTVLGKLIDVYPILQNLSA